MPPIGKVDPLALRDEGKALVERAELVYPSIVQPVNAASAWAGVDAGQSKEASAAIDCWSTGA